MSSGKTCTNIWLLGCRPKTLPAGIAPVVVGTACTTSIANVNWYLFAGVVIVSIGLQVGVNFANDYADGTSGVDEKRTGPTRLVESGLASPAAVRNASLGAFLVASLAGVVVSLVTAPWLILVGVVCVVAGWLYSVGRFSYGRRGLGEVFVFLFFGLVATLGAGFVQNPVWSWAAFAASIVMGAFATTMMLLNNVRDASSDAAAGKQTLAVRLTPETLRILVLVVAAVGIAAFVGFVVQRPFAILGVVALPFWLSAIRVLIRNDNDVQALIRRLGTTGKSQLAIAILMAVGSWISIG